MLKQVQKLITQDVGITKTEITLGVNPNTVITNCLIYSAGTGQAFLKPGPDTSTAICFGTSVNNSINIPIESYLAPIHNLSTIVTVATDGFTAGDEINVIINYREFENINTTSSAIKLSNAPFTATIIGNTPLLANSDSTLNYNIKSIYVSTSTTTNAIDFTLTSTEFPSGILVSPSFTGGLFYRPFALTNQTLLTNGSSLTLNQSEAVTTKVFISYTQVPA
jgi:hypothetical protein